MKAGDTIFLKTKRLLVKPKCKQRRRLELYRFIAAQPLIGLSIREFSISSVLLVLEVLCCQYWHSFYQIDHSTLWWALARVNWLTLCQECHRAVFLARYCSSCTPLSFFTFWRISWSVMPMTSLWYAIVPSPGVRVTVAESLSRPWAACIQNYNKNLFIILLYVHSLPTEELLIFIKLWINSN